MWVASKSKSKKAHPWPLKGECEGRFWSINSLSEAAAQAYQDLYDNTNGMRDDFIAFWEETARRFKDVDGVLGYELM